MENSETPENDHKNDHNVSKNKFVFIDPDGDVLEIGANYSFGHLSITLLAEQGVRMTVSDTKKIIKALTKLIEDEP